MIKIDGIFYDSGTWMFGACFIFEHNSICLITQYDLCIRLARSQDIFRRWNKLIVSAHISGVNFFELLIIWNSAVVAARSADAESANITTHFILLLACTIITIMWITWRIVWSISSHSFFIVFIFAALVWYGIRTNIVAYIENQLSRSPSKIHNRICLEYMRNGALHGPTIALTTLFFPIESKLILK